MAAEAKREDDDSIIHLGETSFAIRVKGAGSCIEWETNDRACYVYVTANDSPSEDGKAKRRYVIPYPYNSTAEIKASSQAKSSSQPNVSSWASFRAIRGFVPLDTRLTGSTYRAKPDVSLPIGNGRCSAFYE